MKPLIKARLYQLRKNRYIYWMFVVLSVMQMLSCVAEILVDDKKNSAGVHVASNGTNMLFVAIAFGIVIAGYICGMNFTDKTANYEMMSGHTRKNIYFSHTILSIVVGIIGTAVLILIPVIFGVVVYGWGTELNAGQTFVRLLIALVVSIRIICEFICLTYITKSPYVTMVGAYGVFMAGMILETSNRYSSFLGITSYIRLGKFDSWMTYTLDDTVNMIMVYDAGLPKGEIISMLVSSVFFGALFLWIGYKYFSKDDMN